MEKLVDYFEGIAWKYLTAVDASPRGSVSNQHELGGLVKAGFKKYLGDPADEVRRFPCRFIYLASEEEKSVSVAGQVSWYDCRRDDPSRGPELRLYYDSNPVTELLQKGMFCLVAKSSSEELTLVFCEPASSEESQLRWLFGLEAASSTFLGKQLTDQDQKPSWATRWILDELGVELHETTADYLELILERFGARFPKTRQFSALALELVGELDPLSHPDESLVALMEFEEVLFRQLERYFVQAQLDEGFEDVDHFIGYSLSIQNRRKSRVGYALENHLEYIFQSHRLAFVRGGRTENKARPDFLFPGVEQYATPSFPADGLTLLGAKSTCKDRWRQVLSEAKRIEVKHLVTLEPAISQAQLEEMHVNRLQLVVPFPLQETYQKGSRVRLWSVSDFLSHVKEQQARYFAQTG